MRLTNAERDALANYEFVERELARYERDGFEVVVMAEPEMDNPLEYWGDDESKLKKRIARGLTEFFKLCVYVYFEDLQLGYSQLGGTTYDDPRETLSNGVAEERISAAMTEAKACVARLIRRFGTANKASAPRTCTPRRRRRVRSQSAGIETSTTCTPTACSK